jgi:hypothetical protein
LKNGLNCRIVAVVVEQLIEPMLIMTVNLILGCRGLGVAFLEYTRTELDKIANQQIQRQNGQALDCL